MEAARRLSPAYTLGMADELTLSGVVAAPGVTSRGRAIHGNTRGLSAGAETRRSQVPASGDGLELSPEAQKKVAELTQTDRMVRAHEAAHMAAGGGLVRGGAAFSYQRGPDGKNYAVAGEVSLDTSPVPDNPAATLRKAEQIKAAALAPADPSPQDHKVAAQASAMALKAAAELSKKTQSAGVIGSGLNLLG